MVSRRRGYWQDVIGRLQRIERKVNRIMTDQEHLDADVAALVDVTGVIAQEIEDLKNQHPEIDFTGLDNALAGLQQLAPAAPAPEPTPAPSDGA